MDYIFILLLALALDLALGDPPTAIHPVGWMGKLISLFERCAPKNGPRAQFLYGAFMVIIGVGTVTAGGYFLMDYLHEMNRIACIIVGAVLLKSVFAITGLRRSAIRVKREIESRDIKGARSQMPALVSRDTETLSEPLLIAATTESVAENTSDSFVAPLFYYLILGVPGAIAYRMANTFDSMVGYHGKYEYLGKFAARLDDVLNFIPARITGLAMVVAAFLGKRNAANAWRVMLRDRGKTESPNAGWPMSAAAGALEVELEKIGHYKLGESRAALTCETIDAVLLLMYLVAFLWVLLCLGIEGVKVALAS
ncbi:MAG: cobalamin biosynthesis protein [Chloroflexi bacterium]|nr:cobalamin biosynthesis protein [Chloroflexota bacterium]